MLSVCMPYWMRQGALDRSLAAYRRLYDDLEISICDDGSPIPVKATGCRVEFLPRKEHALNPCLPMNVAVRNSTRDIVVLTNPEVEHREDVLSDMLSMLERENDYVVATCRDVDGTLLAGDGVDYTKQGRCPVPEGSHFHFCSMLRRSLFEQAGGFDEDYRLGMGCDDNDWLFRLKTVGARFRLSKKVVWHYRSRTQWGLPHNRKLLHRKWNL